MKVSGWPLIALGLGFGLSCGGKEGTAEGKKPAAIAPVKYTTVICTDKEGIGIEAFRMLVPDGWRFSGGIDWVLDNPGMPARAAFTVAAPAGRACFEVFSNQAFFATDNPMTLSNFPPGSRYFGSEVRAVLEPAAMLKEIVLPRFRSGKSGLRVTGEEHLPELARALGAGKPQAGVQTFADAAKLRIEYSDNGVTMEEEIYGVVEGFSYPLQTMYGRSTNTNWFADYLFSFRAEKGKLSGLAKTFETMARSFRLNPRWFSKHNQVVEYLIARQIQAIKNVGELSRIISRTSDEISAMTMKSYEERQAVNDRIAENFSDYVRGVDRYYNPIEERPVELPAGYERAWTNSLGEYILSESPSYNPNEGSNVEWREIQKSK